MRFRFLYLDSDGVETKVESLDELRRCVEDGRVGEDTLLYDALSREWGPARVHTAYRSMLGDDPDAEAETSTLDVDDSLDGDEIELSDAVPDTVGRFLEKRAQERREEDERRPTALDELNVVDEAASWRSGVEEASEEGAMGAGPSVDEPEPTFTGGGAERPEPSPVTVKVNATGGRGRRRQRATVAVVAVLLVAGFFVGRSLLGGSGAEGGTVPAVDTGPPPAANPALEAQIRDAQGSAFQDMVVAMDSLRGVYDVAAVPEEWLSGRYLANASEYPDVEAYWRRYRDYVAELRARDEELFRRGFVRRLEGSGIEGAVLSMRLARATEEFGESSPARDTVYSAMDGMASSALELHRTLVEREDDIAYTPVRPGVVSRDPVLEAVPTDPELRTHIWDILDRMFTHMDVVRGGVPGSGDQLGQAALEGIRNTARQHVP